MQTVRTNETPQSFQQFTALFWQNKILLNGTNLHLGDSSTEILNLSEDFLESILEHRQLLVSLFNDFFLSRRKKDVEFLKQLEASLQALIDDVYLLPPYKYFAKPGLEPFAILFTEPKVLRQISNPHTAEGHNLQTQIKQLSDIVEDIVSFNRYFSALVDKFFEGLKKRNSEYYAIGLYWFFDDTQLVATIEAELPNLPQFKFRQRQYVAIEFTPMRNPDDEEQYILAERTVFNSFAAFIYMDFFRALMNGHAPRRCHNCGKYFLLVSGYNTCYCANLAPQKLPTDKKNTCRDVGSHIKETKKNRTPAKVEYDKVYNRLKTRKARKSITTEDWNKQVALAISYMEQNEQGTLSDADYKEIMRKM